jgi:hypothetical protein
MISPRTFRLRTISTTCIPGRLFALSPKPRVPPRQAPFRLTVTTTARLLFSTSWTLSLIADMPPQMTMTSMRQSQGLHKLWAQARAALLSTTVRETTSGLWPLRHRQPGRLRSRTKYILQIPSSGRFLDVPRILLVYRAHFGLILPSEAWTIRDKSLDFHRP